MCLEGFEELEGRIDDFGVFEGMIGFWILERDLKFL